MNARAHDLTVTLRAILGMLPGATSIGLHAGEAWAIVLITTSSDEAVIALSEDLGLGEVEIGMRDGRWWRRASSERDHGRLRVVVTGPHHVSSPPQGTPSRSG
jgi:hypothetical protein